jgi:hypothetical protein
MDTIRRANPCLQGRIGLGAAIAWFCEAGYEVAIPLNDSQPYDLVVEDAEGRLLKVQVKTTGRLRDPVRRLPQHELHHPLQQVRPLPDAVAVALGGGRRIRTSVG